MFDQFIEPLLAFVRDHQSWAGPLVAIIAFAESLAFFSAFVPGWGVLVGVGALVSAGGLSFWPVYVGAVIGATLGDWLSYAVGYYFKDRVHHWWPFSKNPGMLAKAEDVFNRWGAMGVFIGRFSGPLRATVPLAAGVFEMPQVKFQVANVASALVWAAVLIYGGATGLEAFKSARAAMGW